MLANRSILIEDDRSAQAFCAASSFWLFGVGLLSDPTGQQAKAHRGFRTDAAGKPGACNLIAALAQEDFAGHDLPVFGALKGWKLRDAAKRLVNGSLGHLQAREAAALRYRTSRKDFVQVAQAAFAMKFLF